MRVRPNNLPGDNHYGDAGDSNYDDDIYICLYVTKRHHFLYSKDFVVSPVYRRIPYSKELVVSCFWTLTVFKSVQKE